MADNPPKPWRKRVFHGGTTCFARGARLINADGQKFWDGQMPELLLQV